MSFTSKRAGAVIAGLGAAIALAIPITNAQADAGATAGSTTAAVSTAAVAEAAAGESTQPVRAPVRLGSISIGEARAGNRALPTYRTNTSASQSAIMAVIQDERSSVVDYPIDLKPTQRIESGNDGGAVVIDMVDGREAVVAVIARPWAKGADGRSLPTRYEIQGSVLRQITDTRGATFPVVADPSVSFGHYGIIPVFYSQYTWTEMWKLKNGMDRNQTLTNLLCTMTGAAKAACVIVANYQYNDIRNNVNYGIAHKKCLKIRQALYPSPAAYFVAYDAYTVTCKK